MKHLLGLILATTAFATLPALAQQDVASFPSKPIKIVVPFAVGGGSDIVARTVANELAQRLGQPVIVENRPGAGSSVGSNLALKSPADGYTLLLASSSYSVNPAIYKNLPFDSLNDMTPVIKLGSGPMVVTVTPSLPVNTLPELIAYAKANPNRISYGSSGLGGLTHICTESFTMETQTKMIHVPYRGTAAVVPDLLSGRTQLFLADTGTVVKHIKSSKLRGLAVSSPQRLPELPEVPTLAELGYAPDAFGMVAWQGILAPKGTPAPIIAKLNSALNQIIREDAVKNLFAAQYYMPAGGTPEDFYKLIRADIQRWTAVAKQANIAAE